MPSSAAISVSLGSRPSRALQSRTACSRRRSRAPVDLPQAVENGAANPELGVVLELYVLARIVFPHRVQQAENSGVHQVFQRHLRRQPVVDAPGDVPHLGQMLEHDPLALRVVVPADSLNPRDGPRYHRAGRVRILRQRAAPDRRRGLRDGRCGIEAFRPQSRRALAHAA
jgi:hypothetical protein